MNKLRIDFNNLEDAISFKRLNKLSWSFLDCTSFVLYFEKSNIKSKPSIEDKIDNIIKSKGL